MLCKYKNIFGDPNKGFHSSRLFGLASNDLIATIILTILIIFFYKQNITNAIKTILMMFLFVISIHRIFCVNTALNIMIFGPI